VWFERRMTDAARHHLCLDDHTHLKRGPSQKLTIRRRGALVPSREFICCRDRQMGTAEVGSRFCGWRVLGGQMKDEKSAVLRQQKTMWSAPRIIIMSAGMEINCYSCVEPKKSATAS
jgi:coenzyme PQQ precursor peptide PqqA